MSALKKIKGLVKEARTYSDAIKLLSKEKDIPTLKSFIDFAPLHKSRKLSVEEYIKYRFDKCGEEFRSTFLPYDKASEYWQVLNPYKYASLARDKFIGHALMSELGIPTSKLYFAYNKEADGNGIWVNSLETAREMIQAIDDDRFIVKPSADSAHGQGVGVYCKSDDISFVAEGTTTMLFEGLVKQSGQMSSLNSSSVNTVRIMTALYPNREVKLIAAFIKIGRAGSVVDNAGSGGNVGCAVNIESGELYNAIQFNSWKDVHHIEKHPDSEIQLNGLVLENWPAIVEAVKNYQARIPYLKTIGWDVALTDDGPVIIKFNNWWDTTGQLFIGKGWHKQVKECYDAWVAYYRNGGK